MQDGQIVEVSTNYKAERSVSEFSVITTIRYQTATMDFGRDRIEVRASIARYGKKGWEGAQINWSSIGAVPAAEAQEFSEALAFAVAEASRIDNYTLTLTK
jgi:hypothetical protein